MSAVASGESASVARSNGATAAPAVPVTVVSSVSEFESIFRSSSNQSSSAAASDAFLLCYEQPADGITSDGLMNFQEGVEAAAKQHDTRLRLYLWDCSSASFSSAKAQLEKQPGHPLLLIVFRGAIADTIRGVTLEHLTTKDVPQLCSRLSSFQSSAKPARVVRKSENTMADSLQDSTHSNGAPSPTQQQQLPQQQEQHLSVDVAKMVGMGQRLMAERKPFYAEKFFAKALLTLDAVANDVDHLIAAREDYDGSVALCLAWAGLAQLVQGKQPVENAYLRRLGESEQLRVYREEPLSDACRAVVTWELMQSAPRTWSEADCSAAKLRETLQTSPHDAAARSMLVVTLFLSGDVERALTEALKLHVCGDAFGRVALRQISAFLGSDHALVKQLGVSSVPHRGAA